MKTILAILATVCISLSVNAQERKQSKAPSLFEPLNCADPTTRRKEYIELKNNITSMLSPFGFVSSEKYGRLEKELYPLSSIAFVSHYTMEMASDKDRLAIVARFHIHRIQNRILIAQEANPTSVRSEIASLLGIMEDFPALFHAALQQADVNKDSMMVGRHLSESLQSLTFFMLRVSDLIRCIGNLPSLVDDQAKMQELRTADWRVSGARSLAQTKRDEALVPKR